MGRSLLLWAALYCLCFAGVRSQPFSPFDPLQVATTQRAGGELRQMRHWSFLYKLCVGPGLHTVVAKYFFPVSSQLALGAAYNSSQLESPWIMLYPESKWQDAYFYIVRRLRCALCFCCNSIYSALCFCYNSIYSAGTAGRVRRAPDGHRPYLRAVT